MNANDLKNLSKTDWEQVDTITDETIDTSDIPPLGEDFFANAKVRFPKRNNPTIQLDQDILFWFKTLGKEYQTHINTILRTYMETHQNS